jgi:hypothetical protein
MDELSQCMKIIVIINLKKDIEDYKESVKLLKNLKTRIEILKIYFLIAWDMHFVSHQFFAEINDRLEEVGREASSWKNWFEEYLISLKGSDGQI